jgi:hypothetical protein
MLVVGSHQPDLEKKGWIKGVFGSFATTRLTWGKEGKSRASSSITITRLTLHLWWLGLIS